MEIPQPYTGCVRFIVQETCYTIENGREKLAEMTLATCGVVQYNAIIEEQTFFWMGET